MARVFAPIVPPNDPRQCAPWLNRELRRISTALSQGQRGMAAVARGESPDASGSPLVDLSGVFLLLGRVGGQIAAGSTQAGGNLTLTSTTHPTKGFIYFGNPTIKMAFDETNGRLGIGTSVPYAPLHTKLTALGTHQRWEGGDDLSVSNVTSTGSTTVTSAAGFAQVTLGMLVTGTLVPANTRVTAWNTSSSITLSNAVPAGTSTMAFQNILEMSNIANGTGEDMELRSSAGLRLVGSTATPSGQAGGIRITTGTTSTTLMSTIRTFLQFGSATNLSAQLGGLNGANGDSLHSMFSYVSFNTWNGTALTNSTRVGINIDPFEFTGSAAGSRQRSFHVADFPGTAETDPAAVIVENSNSVAGRRLIEIRAASTTTAAPNRAIGTVQIGLASALTTGLNNENGRLLFFNGGTLRTIITSGGSSGADSRLTFRTSADVRYLEFERFNTWAGGDDPTTVIMAPTNIMFLDPTGIALSRLGIAATSTVMGPRALSNMPDPVSSRILTLVDSSANVVAAFSSIGALLVDLPSTGSVALTLEHPSGTDDFLVCTTAGVGNTASIDANGSFNLVASSPLISWAGSGVIGSGDFVAIDFADLTPAAGGTTLRLPAVTGTTDMTFVFTAATQTLTNKTINSTLLGTSMNINCNTGTGVTFRDASATTKTMRLDLSGISTSTNRNIKLLDDAGTWPLIVAPTSATTDKTGQTATIAATTVYTTTHAGFYRLSAYWVFTAVTAAGTLSVSALFTDPQQAQTELAINAAAFAAAGDNAFGSVEFYATSGTTIQFSTTLVNTGTYNVYVRVESLS